MAQITIYMDDQTLGKIELAARRAHESISKWVKKHLVGVLESNWPAGYFDLFGSLANEVFERPPQLIFSQDIRKERL